MLLRWYLGNMGPWLGLLRNLVVVGVIGHPWSWLLGPGCKRLWWLLLRWYLGDLRPRLGNLGLRWFLLRNLRLFRGLLGNLGAWLFGYARARGLRQYITVAQYSDGGLGARHWGFWDTRVILRQYVTVTQHGHIVGLRI